MSRPKKAVAGSRPERTTPGGSSRAGRGRQYCKLRWLLSAVIGIFQCIFELKMPRPVIWQRFTSTNSCHEPPLTDAGCLVLSWNHSKSIPCLLVRHKYRHTNHHAAASLSFKFVSAPLGATHNTNATRPTTSTTAPPCPPPTCCTGGPTRAVACEAEYFFRVVVVASSSVVRSGRSGTT